jgi:hypothetical protein
MTLFYRRADLSTAAGYPSRYCRGASHRPETTRVVSEKAHQVRVLGGEAGGLAVLCGAELPEERVLRGEISSIIPSPTVRTAKA